MIVLYDIVYIFYCLCKYITLNTFFFKYITIYKKFY